MQQQGPHRKWQRLAAVAVVLALGACTPDSAILPGETDTLDASIDAQIEDGAPNPDTAFDVVLTDTLPDTVVVDVAPDVSSVDAADEVTAACGWPAMTCPGVCPAPYPCGHCDKGNACGWVAMPPMSTPREEFNAAWGDDGLYVWGGISDVWATPSADAKPWWNGLLASGEKWDPKTNTWSMLPQAPMLPARNAAVVWADDRLLVVGRDEYPIAPLSPIVPWTANPAIGAIWLPKDGKWQPMSSVNYPGSLGAVAWTGTKLVNAGRPYDWKGKSGVEYDPKTDTWTDLPPLPPECANMSATFSGWTGSALIMFDPNVPIGAVWLPAAATWETFTPAPGEKFPAFNYSGSIGIPGGMVAIGSPFADKTDMRLWFRWQSGTGWESVSLPSWQSWTVGHFVAWTGKYIALWSGFESVGDHGFPTTKGALYDPVTKVWTPMSQLAVPSGRTDGAAVVHDGVFYAVGGGDGPCCVNVTFADGGRLLLPP